MRRTELAALVDRLPRELRVPVEGMTLVAFAAALRIDPAQTIRAARFLHRKKLLWLSERDGVMRIFPGPILPQGRGRPPACMVKGPPLIDPDLRELLVSLFPVFLDIRLLESQKPQSWSESAARRAEISMLIDAGAGKIAGQCRAFAERNVVHSPAAIRETLWIAYPDLMPIVVRSRPDLAVGDAPFQGKQKPLKRKVLPDNLSDDERMLRYIEAAGPDGIPVYDIVTKFGGKIRRDRVEELGRIFEDAGKIRSAIVRPSTRGRRGLRYFLAAYGEPVVHDSGRFVLRGPATGTISPAPQA